MYFRVSRFKNYREVVGRRFCVETEDITHRLVVKMVELTDTGDVECQAKNKHGTVSLRAKLTILGK